MDSTYGNQYQQDMIAQLMGQAGMRALLASASSSSAPASLPPLPPIPVLPPPPTHIAKRTSLPPNSHVVMQPLGVESRNVVKAAKVSHGIDITQPQSQHHQHKQKQQKVLHDSYYKEEDEEEDEPEEEEDEEDESYNDDTDYEDDDDYDDDYKDDMRDEDVEEEEEEEEEENEYLRKQQQRRQRKKAMRQYQLQQQVRFLDPRALEKKRRELMKAVVTGRITKQQLRDFQMMFPEPEQRQMHYLIEAAQKQQQDQENLQQNMAIEEAQLKYWKDEADKKKSEKLQEQQQQQMKLQKQKDQEMEDVSSKDSTATSSAASLQVAHAKNDQASSVTASTKAKAAATGKSAPPLKVSSSISISLPASLMKKAVGPLPWKSSQAKATKVKVRARHTRQRKQRDASQSEDDGDGEDEAEQKDVIMIDQEKKQCHTQPRSPQLTRAQQAKLDAVAAADSKRYMKEQQEKYGLGSLPSFVGPYVNEKPCTRRQATMAAAVPTSSSTPIPAAAAAALESRPLSTSSIANDCVVQPPPLTRFQQESCNNQQFIHYRLLKDSLKELLSDYNGGDFGLASCPVKLPRVVLEGLYSHAVHLSWILNMGQAIEYKLKRLRLTKGQERMYHLLADSDDLYTYHLKPKSALELSLLAYIGDQSGASAYYCCRSSDSDVDSASHRVGILLSQMIRECPDPRHRHMSTLDCFKAHWSQDSSRAVEEAIFINPAQDSIGTIPIGVYTAIQHRLEQHNLLVDFDWLIGVIAIRIIIAQMAMKKRQQLARLWLHRIQGCQHLSFTIDLKAMEVMEAMMQANENLKQKSQDTMDTTD